MKHDEPRIAFVYDRVNKWGGAERVLLALHKIWPQAPLFTAVYDPVGAPWGHVFDVRSSFLQHFPFAKTHHEFFPWLTPFAFESFTFDEFDIVLSITSAEAKSIITKPETLHICYCLTPTRYLWSGVETYQSHPGLGPLDAIATKFHKILLPTLRSWDYIGAQRPDRYVAISHHVEDRITQYYHRSVDKVIYPPVDGDFFSVQNSARKSEQGTYYLLVARLVGFKRIDLVIDAFNALGWPLTIIGDGHERAALMARAKSNITFVPGHLTDEELFGYYQSCRAFVFAGVEDFGIVAVEAQACGKPVITYRKSGMVEIVRDGKTGIVFYEQTVESLTAALEQCEKTPYDSDLCRENALRFATKRFQKEMKQYVEETFHKKEHA